MKYSVNRYSHITHMTDENKRAFYRGEEAMRKFCQDIKENAAEIINCQKKILPLTMKEENNTKKFNEMF